MYVPNFQQDFCFIPKMLYFALLLFQPVEMYCFDASENSSVFRLGALFRYIFEQ